MDSSPFRTIRDLGGAAWAGGALMGATGLNAAADAAGVGGADREIVVTAGWARWTPVFRALALAHLAGSFGVVATERSRSAAAALGLSVSAAGAVVGAGVVGKRKGSERTVHALEFAVPGLLAAAFLAARR